MADLRIGRTVLDAYARVAADWKNIGLPALVLTTFIIAFEALYTDLLGLDQDPMTFVVVGDVLLAFFFHRLILLAPADASRKFLKAMNAKLEGLAARFAWFIVLILVIYSVFRLTIDLVVLVAEFKLPASVGPISTSILIYIALGIGLTLIFARVSFAFPALAILERSGFVQAWRQTRGCGLRLAAIYACLLIPFVMLGLIFEFGGQQLAPGGSAMTEIMISIATYMLQFFGIAVLVAMISLSYRTVVQPAVLMGTEGSAAGFD